MTDRARYHVEGQTSTVGRRWGVWDNAEGHFLRYRNIADRGDAYALCDKLNEYERRLTPPEGDAVSEGVVEQVAKAFHGAMVYAVREFKGEPQPWQNGNSTAESYARREAREIIAALQSRPAVDPYAHRDGSRECRPASRVSPQAGMREALVRAYEQGALDVHEAWVEDLGEENAPSRDPDFAEAAYDYADAALSTALIPSEDAK